jgi:hypothetical protein
MDAVVRVKDERLNIVKDALGSYSSVEKQIKNGL